MVVPRLINGDMYIANPCDAPSRGLFAKALLESDSWRSGPDLLWQDESSWQTPPACQEDNIDDNLEIKRDLDKSMETIEKLLSYFSSWVNLRKSMAYILCFKLWSQVGGLCKAKESKVGAFEELGHLFSVLQARRFSMFVRKFAWAKHTLYPPSK